jgi:MFS family permease
MNKGKLSKNVIVLGLVSFFNDFASEMVYPVVPIFLTVTLGAPVAIVGLIEGIAESTASLLKVVSGWLSDKFRKRKLFVATGYSLSTFSKVVIGFAQSWPLVLLGRFADRFGKGVRTSARDALIAESADGSIQGKAFGFHRSLDTLGAVIGPLAAMFFISYFGGNLRPIFYLAFIPGAVGVFLLLSLVKEKPSFEKTLQSPKISFKNLNPAFKIFLVSSIFFALGNSSDAFLILRAKNLGLTTTLSIFAYVVFNLFYALFSFPAGVLSDKIGPKKLLSFGFFFFALIYLLFGFTHSTFLVWLLFALYGIYMAMTEGVGKAYISQIGEKESLATSFGVYQTLVGICTFFASLAAGLLWSKINPSAPFVFGSVLATAAGVIFLFFSKSYDSSFQIN